MKAQDKLEKLEKSGKRKTGTKGIKTTIFNGFKTLRHLLIWIDSEFMISIEHFWMLLRLKVINFINLYDLNIYSFTFFIFNFI